MSKLYYCPRCGHLEKEEFYEISNTCECRPLFSPKLLPMEEEYEDFDLTKPMDVHQITQDMYELAYEKYVNIPSNKKLNVDEARELQKCKQELFADLEYENFRRKMMSPEEFSAEMNRMYGKPYQPQTPLKPGQCPYCLSMMTTARTSCFDLGGAIIGGALFGEPGAVFGAMGEERTYYVCQKCGNKWEPGKYR